MKIQYDISLKNYNTFGIDVQAKRFTEITSVYALQQLLKIESDVFVISGGSNMLLTSNIDKLVIYLNIKGISIDREDEEAVYLTVNAGENWHEFVLWSISQNYGGIENLSLIPGNVGTCPVQNIGAYGVEVKDVITKVEAIDIATQKLVTFSNDDCNFGYRDSIFKNTQKGKYIITSVSFKLLKAPHVLKTSYGAITTELEALKKERISIKDVSNAVIAIRSSKLPDPKEIGNSGSFFKNPVISITAFNLLKEKYPTIPNYVVSNKEVKVPAGWLIEQSGFKGKRFGNCGVHEKQALVLVNYGESTGIEIYNLAKEIQKVIKENFNIVLDIEVNII